MFPFQFKNKAQSIVKKDTFSLWFKVAVACVPSAIMGILFDDYLDAYLQTPIVISIMLIFYGLLFILIENWNKKRTPTTMALSDISYKTAILIGAFQVLSLIPGTSRSGATIIGALLIGVSRVAAAEFFKTIRNQYLVNNMMKYVVNHSCSESLHRYLINGMLIRLIKRDMDGWLRWKTNNYC